MKVQIHQNLAFSVGALVLSVATIVILLIISVRAQSESGSATRAEGEELERQMAADVEAKNWRAVEMRIAEGFQSVHPDGVRDRAGEIALLKAMKMGKVTLNNFESTTIGDNIVVTFTMTASETIDGKRLPAKPAYRLSVWKKGVNGWQWISHTNLTPIRQESLRF